eukprot:CAMPEP_0171502528 /NCGR_PEP_ID=MMETSP0958-20121227/10238_1 /TAXON_ID=87120 /ORGANISM="Aurantiochytrium limacinum, Strain ATCCMYA-1381" /LENGTH=144 /DNA_ID=CAMNT_0012037613 /DNA_START=782 /DNA_END=1216 /DNA_ORIENTATION=+
MPLPPSSKSVFETANFATATSMEASSPRPLSRTKAMVLRRTEAQKAQLQSQNSLQRLHDSQQSSNSAGSSNVNLGYFEEGLQQQDQRRRRPRVYRARAKACLSLPYVHKEGDKVTVYSSFDSYKQQEQEDVPGKQSHSDKSSKL